MGMFIREAISRRWNFLRLIQEFVLDSQVTYHKVVPIGQGPWIQIQNEASFYDESMVQWRK